MKVDTLKPYTNSVYPNNIANRVSDGYTYPENRSSGLSSSGEGNSSNILTQKERDFFVKMFPQNSEQIQNHVVFNRNGKLQSSNVSKGVIIDGRV
jgi:hypothetical protein